MPDAANGAVAAPPSAATTGMIVGELAPWFHARAIGGNPRYAFDTIGGRYVLLCLFGSAADPEAQKALTLVINSGDLFDDTHACFFGISGDPEDEIAGRVVPRMPGLRYFLDADGSIAAQFKFVDGGATDWSRCWLLLDPMMRIVARFPLEAGENALRAVAAVSRAPSPVDNAPILVVPNIFDGRMCQDLIARYKAGKPEPSGFMREIDGKTTLVHDKSHKVRTDFIVDDPKLVRALGQLIARRLVPMIARAFQFRVNRMERYLVSGYDAQTGGHFAPHRDNTTKGTAHRRFAVTLNLNAGEYEGGDLVFPEFGQRRYRAPTGGAVVFSCSLLHQATRVTKGTRYAFLPFLYDDAGADLREANNSFLGEGTQPYSRKGDRIC